MLSHWLRAFGMLISFGGSQVRHRILILRVKT